jgi:HK97 family phage prohead protease
MTTLYATITKADDQRLVYGIASTESLDQQGGVWDGQAYVGDVVDPGAIEGALPDYMEWGAVREMHQPIAAGTAIKAAVEDGKLLLTVRVVDDGAWAKVKAGVYKGFSIGGKVVKAVLEKLPDGSYVRRILKLLLTEISLVDRPANPDAKILVFKRAEGVQPHMANELIVSPTAGRQPSAPDVWDKLQQKLAAVQKAAADPQKIIAMIQQARNDCELGGDMEGAQLLTQAIALVLQANGDAEAPDDTSDAADAATADDPAAADVAAADDTASADDDADAALMMAARVSGGAAVHKAGRAISGGRMAAMKSVVKTLLQLMADAGTRKPKRRWEPIRIGLAQQPSAPSRMP